MVINYQLETLKLLFLDPDPFTHMKKNEGGDEEMDLSFLKEFEQEDQQQNTAQASTEQKK